VFITSTRHDVVGREKKVLNPIRDGFHAYLEAVYGKQLSGEPLAEQRILICVGSQTDGKPGICRDKCIESCERFIDQTIVGCQLLKSASPE
jgi:hypothetical protein